MNIIKLSAIDSTNDYLKINFSELIKKEIHIAYTFNQTNGKGQRGNSWVSEPEKNLAFSIIFSPNNFNIKNQFKVCVHGLVTLIIRETAYRRETIRKV